jgi:hypothetical protein
MDVSEDTNQLQPTNSLKQFAPLLGEWTTVGTHPAFSSPVHGHSSFTWMEENVLLLWHFDWDQPLPPNAVSVIGHDDEVDAGTCTVLYTDERGVSRIYRMSMDSGVWKMWREAPGFSQRLTGTFSDDGNTITCHGELSTDGSHWEQDLDVTYTRQP